MPLNYDQQSWLTPEQVIAVATLHGYKITLRQVRRWQSAGLIPRPTKVHLKGRSGSRSLYPPHTGEQVASVCKIGEQLRANKLIGWYLWRLGWPVADKYWKPIFELAVREFGVQLQPNLTPVESDKSKKKPKYELTEEFEEKIEEAAQIPISHPIAGRIKQKLGKERFATLGHHGLQIVLGNFSDDSLFQSHGSDDQISLSKILSILFSPAKDVQELVIANWQYLSCSVPFGTIGDIMKKIPTDELQVVSKELANIQGLIPALQGHREGVASVNGIPSFSLDHSLKSQAQLIMLWAIARQLPENRKNIARHFSKNSETPDDL